MADWGFRLRGTSVAISSGMISAIIAGCGQSAVDVSQAEEVPAAAVDEPKVEPPAAEAVPKARPERTERQESKPDKSEPEQPTDERVIRFTPEEFKAEFDGGDPKLRQDGIVLEVSGEVTGVHTSFGNQPFVTLQTKGDDPDLGTPYYTVDREPWGRLAPRQQVTLQGRWDGERGWIFEIEKAGPNPAPLLTATALAKEFAADREATEAKYRGKSLYVTGKVAEKTLDGAVLVMLEGTKDVPVACTITAFDKALADAIQLGQTVTFCGEYFPGLSKDGPSLAVCRPVSSFQSEAPHESTKPDQGKPPSAVGDTTASSSNVKPVEPVPETEWLHVADEMQAKRDAIKLIEGATAFEGPPGNGRRGAHGFLLPVSPSSGARRSEWRFTWEWNDTARGVHVVHPFRTGHLLVLIYREYASIYPGGDWPHDEYLGKSSHPVQTTEAYESLFPLSAKKPVTIVSRLEADGRYSLLIEDRVVLMSKIDAAEPLSLPDSFEGDRLPTTWPAGSAGMIVGPVDTGFNRVSDIELLAMKAGAALDDLRQPVPSDEVQREALKAVRQLLTDDYAKVRDAGSKQVLARKLHELAIETRRDPDARFVMLREAKDLAAESLDVERLAAVIESLDQHYAVDASQLSRESLERMARDVTAQVEGKPIVRHSLDLAGKAEQRGAFDEALAFVTTASIAATRMRDADLLDEVRERRRELEDLKLRSAEAMAARAVLEETPDDPQANQTLGSYLLFARGDWRQGLPLLAKCGDEELQSLAERELANVRTPESLVALGDAWYELSESRTGRQHIDYRRRAAAWYRQAVEQVTGLTQERIKQRLEAMEAEE